jgi:nitroreductase
MSVSVETDFIETLKGRATAPRLTQPAPDDAQLATILAAASAAPDHGRLKPWRFFVIRGSGLAEFGELLVRNLLRRLPEATPEQVDREREKPKRAPLIVLVAAHIEENKKIPEVEQLLAVGAATQNLLLAAHALGYGSAWKTGDAAYDNDVKAAFGLRQCDAILGFIYLGTVEKVLPRRALPELGELVKTWSGQSLKEWTV